MRAQCSIPINIWHPSRTLPPQELQNTSAVLDSDQDLAPLFHFMGPGGPKGPSRPQKAPEGHRRPQKAPEGTRKAPAGHRWPQETPEGTRKPQKAPEGTRRPQKAPEGPRRHQKAPEGPRKHQKAPEATRRPEKIPGPKPQAQGRRPQATGQTTGPECLLCRPAMPQADRGSQVTTGSRSQIADHRWEPIADRRSRVGGRRQRRSR